MLQVNQLSGFGGSGVVPPVTWSFVGSCQSTGSSLDFSSLSAGAIQANDVAVFIDYAALENPPSSVTPSGFTNRVDTSGLSEPGARAMVSTKKLTGSETTITGMDASGVGADDNKLGLVFRPSRDFTTFTVSTPQDSGIIDGNPSAITVDPSAETLSVVLLGFGATYLGTVSFSVVTPAFEAEIAISDNDLQSGYKIYASSPVSHSIDMSDLGNCNWLAGFYFTAS